VDSVFSHLFILTFRDQLQRIELVPCRTVFLVGCNMYFSVSAFYQVTEDNVYTCVGHPLR
jgi:hypothetical protein